VEVLLAERAVTVDDVAVSGVVSCRLTAHKKSRRQVTTVSYAATAIDKAGNTATAKGSDKIKKRSASRTTAYSETARDAC
jgi:hypothetical protein